MRRATDWDIASPVEVEQVVRRRSLLTGNAPSSFEADRRGRAAGSSVRSAPRRVDFSQDEAREQRRQMWAVHYTDFDLCREVAEQCRPLANEIQALLADGVRLADRRNYGDSLPPMLEPLRDVQRIAESVRDLRAAVAELLAKTPPAMLPDGARGRLSAIVRDPAHRATPEVDEGDLYDGSWVDRAVALVEPLSADLAAVVAAQSAGMESDVDAALSEALVKTDMYGVGFDQSVGMLRSRLPELRDRRQRALAARAAAVQEAEEREEARVAGDLRKLRLP